MTPVPDDRRRAIVRNALGIGAASGAYAVSFGALSVSAGLSVLQTCVLSLLMFTGASQFALVGVLASGGGALSAASTAVLLGTRNAFYGLPLARLLDVRRWKRPATAHFVLDESTAMAVAQATDDEARLAFWATGLSVFVLWNLATLIGGLGARAFSDPKVLGLDAAAPAAFLALLRPRLVERETWAVAAVAAVVAVAVTPAVPRGVPVLCAAAIAVLAGVGRQR